MAYGKGTSGFRLVLYTVGGGLSSGLGTGRGILGRKLDMPLILDSRQHKAGPSGLLYSCLPHGDFSSQGQRSVSLLSSHPLRSPSLLPLFPSSPLPFLLSVSYFPDKTKRAGILKAESC